MTSSPENLFCSISRIVHQHLLQQLLVELLQFLRGIALDGVREEAVIFRAVAEIGDATRGL